MFKFFPPSTQSSSTPSAEHAIPQPAPAQSVAPALAPTAPLPTPTPPPTRKIIGLPKRLHLKVAPPLPPPASVKYEKMTWMEVMDLTKDDPVPTSEVVDLTMDDDVTSSDVVEIVDDNNGNKNPDDSGDVEMVNPPDAESPPATPDMQTRRTIRSWAGSYRPENWITSRQNFDTTQVDRDSTLPAAVSEDDYPVFVKCITFVCYIYLTSSTGCISWGHGIVAYVYNVPLQTG
jgi:hypothetical protein